MKKNLCITFNDCTDAWRMSGIRGYLPAMCSAGWASDRMFASRDGPLLDCFVVPLCNVGYQLQKLIANEEKQSQIRIDCFVPGNDRNRIFGQIATASCLSHAMTVRL